MKGEHVDKTVPSNRPIQTYRLFTITLNVHEVQVSRLLKKVILLFFFHSRDEINISKPKAQHQYPSVSYVYSEKCRRNSIDKPYMTENVIVRPSFEPRGKWKFQNQYCTSARHVQSYPGLFTPENVNVVEVSNFTEKKKRWFTTLIRHLGIKWKFGNSIAHLEGIPNHTLEYHLSTMWNKNRVPLTITSPKTSFNGP